MTKIEELIHMRKKYIGFDEELNEYSIIRIAQDYAEWYAKKCLDLADKLPNEIPIGSFQLPEHE
jgi:hypothetical protein